MGSGVPGSYAAKIKLASLQFTEVPHLSHHPVLTAVGSGRQDGYFYFILFYFHFTEEKTEGQRG